MAKQTDQESVDGEKDSRQRKDSYNKKQKQQDNQEKKDNQSENMEGTQSHVLCGICIKVY